jgi:hypothetical protein
VSAKASPKAKASLPTLELLDTSVLLNLLQVPFESDDAAHVKA